MTAPVVADWRLLVVGVRRAYVNGRRRALVRGKRARQRCSLCRRKSGRFWACLPCRARKARLQRVRRARGTERKR